jgi:protein gp37
MSKTTIEWTDFTVNPIRVVADGKFGWHCTKVSPGCAHCYAEVINRRFGTGMDFTGANAAKVKWILDDTALAHVFQRRKPTRFFWGDMTDLFHEQVRAEWLDKCFAVMALTPQHTHQVLTKRTDQMAGYMADGRHTAIIDAMNSILRDCGEMHAAAIRWPLPNVWLGTSVENQKAADERIPHLLRCPAAVRFLSCEPLLGPVDLTEIGGDSEGNCLNPECWGDCACDKVYGHDPGCRRHGGDGQLTRRIHWVIVGGESGPKARPMHPDLARSIRDQCQAAGVPFFFKQMARREPIPDDLMIREFPKE